MTIDLKLNPAHDLQLSDSGDLLLVDGALRVRQQIEVTLLTFLGEWFMDITFGVPYLEQIMVKSPNRVLVENVIRARVNDVPGVVRVPTVIILIDPTTRRARIQLDDIKTTEGLISLSVTNLGA